MTEGHGGHEANREEGANCYRIAKQAFQSGDIDRAQRFAEKAARLIPNQRQVPIFAPDDP